MTPNAVLFVPKRAKMTQNETESKIRVKENRRKNKLVLSWAGVDLCLDQDKALTSNQ